MSRRYYRKRYYNQKKYSVENKAFRITLNSSQVNNLYQANRNILVNQTIEGMRKVKNITCTLAIDSNNDQTNPDDLINSIYWAWVYVPSGTSVGNLSLDLNGSTSWYEPNQFVINSGVVDPSAGPIRFYSNLSRNLNSGDNIYLVVGSTDYNVNTHLNCVCRYAITLQ